jgi:phage FluMu gp28-like protein
VDVRRTARNEQRFVRLRDELWWKLREQFEKGNISIPDDSDLVDQLSSVKWSEQNGRIKVQGKKEMKANGKDSPDEADALCLTFHYRDDTFRKDVEPLDAYEEDEKPKTSWLAA